MSEPRYGERDGWGRYGLLATDGKGRLVCHDCGEGFDSLGTHARHAHGMNAAEYRARHGLGRTTKLVSGSLAARMQDAWQERADTHLATLAANRPRNPNRPGRTPPPPAARTAGRRQAAGDYDWEERLADVVAWRAARGRLPKNSARAEPSEASLGAWVTEQRRQHNAGRLRLDRIQLLDKSLPGWEAADRRQQWKQTALDLSALYQQIGHLPRQRPPQGAPHREEEQRLGRWLERQRRAARAATLSAARRRTLDQVAPGWDHTTSIARDWSRHHQGILDRLHDEATAARYPDLRAWMIALHEQGLPMRATAAVLGITTHRVGRLIHELDIPWNPVTTPNPPDGPLVELALRLEHRKTLPRPDSTNPTDRRLIEWLIRHPDARTRLRRIYGAR